MYVSVSCDFQRWDKLCWNNQEIIRLSDQLELWQKEQSVQQYSVWAHGDKHIEIPERELAHNHT